MLVEVWGALPGGLLLLDGSPFRLRLFGLSYYAFYMSNFLTYFSYLASYSP